MNISGPTPIGPRIEDSLAHFRLNQRFEAEVLQVAGEKVALTVSGVAIVARMTSPEQAAILTQHRRALFQVLETGPELRLKLVPPGTGSLGETPTLNDPVANLLRMTGLPADEINLHLARACMQNRVVVTKEFIAQMRSCLEQALETLGQEKSAAQASNAALSHAAQTAVGWAASGRPLTPATLALLLQDLPGLPVLLARLRAGLQSARQLSPENSARVETTLEWLEAIEVELPEQGSLAAKLHKSIRLMGQSLEHELVAQHEDVDERTQSGLYNLALLRRSLPAGEHAGLVREIDRLLDKLGQQNLYNTAPTQPALREHWIAVELPCMLRRPGETPELTELPIRLRILKDAQTGDAEHSNQASRLIIQAEVNPGKVLEIDLSIQDRQVRVCVTAPDSDVGARAGEHLESYNLALEKLGYNVQDALVGVKDERVERPVGGVLEETKHRADWKA